MRLTNDRPLNVGQNNTKPTETVYSPERTDDRNQKSRLGKLKLRLTNDRSLSVGQNNTKPTETLYSPERTDDRNHSNQINNTQDNNVLWEVPL